MGEEIPPYVRTNVGPHFNLLDHDEDAQAAQVILVLDAIREKLDAAVTPYSLCLVVRGHFRAFNLPTDEDDSHLALRIVCANGAEVLYGVAREVAETLALRFQSLGLFRPSRSSNEAVKHETQLEESGPTAA